jgi:DNA-dependent RNA polymerase auxiliary subunit epsilon
MSQRVKVLQPSDIEIIQQFEQKILNCRVEDPTDRELASWHAPWRRESLEHYLPMGWSFGLFGPDLLGYFIAQPQLFTRGMTQSLWVEHLSANSESEMAELTELARKLCREKHFQMLYVQEANGEILEIKTAKF